MGLRGPLPKTPKTTRGVMLLKRVPAPPKSLRAEGRSEWRRVAAELGPKGRNVLTESTVGLLEDLARAADDAARFREVWEREGMTVEGQGRDFAHPMLIAEREARKVVAQLRRELGVTPASTLRVPAGAPPEEPKADPLAEFD